MKTKIMLAFVIFLLITNLSAFDGKRKGFILGYGVGISNVTFKQEIEGYGESDSETEIGFATDFKIGFAPNNKFEIYYSSQVAWFSLKNIYNESVTISDGVGAISMSYFLSSGLDSSEWCRSGFLSAGYGFSGWSTPFEEGSESWIGSGFFAGAGYEFSKHYRISLNLFSNNPSIDEDGITFTTKSTVLMLTISALAF